MTAIVAVMEISLEGKVALVTGASRGIGKAIAKSYVEAGAKVMLMSRKEDALRAAADEIGGDTAIFAGNAGDIETAQACVAATIKNLDRSISLLTTQQLIRMQVQHWALTQHDMTKHFRSTSAVPCFGVRQFGKHG